MDGADDGRAEARGRAGQPVRAARRRSRRAGPVQRPRARVDGLDVASPERRQVATPGRTRPERRPRYNGATKSRLIRGKYAKRGRTNLALLELKNLHVALED